MAEKLQTIEDETNAEVFVINGNHDIYNYQDSCTFETVSYTHLSLFTLMSFR